MDLSAICAKFVVDAKNSIRQSMSQALAHIEVPFRQLIRGNRVAADEEEEDSSSSSVSSTSENEEFERGGEFNGGEDEAESSSAAGPPAASPPPPLLQRRTRRAFVAPIPLTSVERTRRFSVLLSKQNHQQNLVSMCGDKERHASPIRVGFPLRSAKTFWKQNAPPSPIALVSFDKCIYNVQLLVINFETKQIINSSLHLLGVICTAVKM